MKIAMLTNNYRPFVGGVPISVERQARELIKRGHEVTVFAPAYGDTVEDQERMKEEDEKGEEKVIRFQTRKKKMENGMVCPTFCPKEIVEQFKRQEFDYIHVHHPMFVGTCGIYLKKKYGIPLIYTYHTRYEDYLHYIPGLKIDEHSSQLKKHVLTVAKEKIVPTYMKWFADQCDLVLAPSNGMKQMLEAQGATTRVEIFPTGLDSEFYEQVQIRARKIREHYAGNKKHLFVTVSRLEKEKNYDFLLNGIARLKELLGVDFQVLIIGDGSQGNELKKKASALDIEDVITFIGNVPNRKIKEYLQSADLFLFSSKSETQGIVLVEAMAAGLPVIALHATGVDDIVIDGVNGYLTEEKEELWAKKIAVACTPKIRKCLQISAWETAEKYRAETLALKEEMLYNQCSIDLQEKQMQYLIIH